MTAFAAFLDDKVERYIELRRSLGYRPKRTAHDAIKRVTNAIAQRKTRVLDFDLRAYFDNVRHDRLLAKVAQRINDADVMHLPKSYAESRWQEGGSARRCAFALAQ
ncbi:retron-type reverse transcriptase [Bradyrhizobium sp. USDA 4503]